MRANCVAYHKRGSHSFSKRMLAEIPSLSVEYMSKVDVRFIHIPFAQTETI